MPFYLRKSLRFGPLRFNLSSAGVGVSTGWKGFRVGTGPRGHYIHAGAGGIYYRNTFNARSSKSEDSPSGLAAVPKDEEPRQNGYTDFRQIDSADASTLVDADSREIIAQLDDARKKWRIAPFPTALTALLIGISIAADSERSGFVLAGAITGAIALLASWIDRRRKTTVLFYNLEPPVLESFEILCASFDTIANCERAWNIETEARVVDPKYAAGATMGVKRHPSTITTQAPPGVKTNVSTPCIPVGHQTLYFFPDRVLVFDTAGVGVVSYGDLRIESLDTRFVEEESVPSDAKIVDRTWRYVNKKGGPDRRFKHNREIPIVLYGEV